MSRTKSVLFGVVIACVLSLSLSRVHPFGDAGLFAPTKGAPLEHADIPPNVRQLLVNKCASCHSTQVSAPFYGHLAPASWLMERDIVEARREMDLSQWSSYSPERQDMLKSKMLAEVKTHRMPLLQYRLIHWNAQISSDDIAELSEWVHGPAEHSAQPGPVAGEGDAVRGRDVFERRCMGCHSMEQNREGPRLQGVFGRAAGSVSGFDYSPALKQTHIVWDDRTLEQWLADSDALAPGNNMDFQLHKSQERSDIIQFLREIAGK
jgi:cytochrome c